MRKYILALVILLLPFTASATILGVQQGGTASSSLTGILIGNGISPINTLTLGTNLSLTGTTLNATGGSGGSGVATTSLLAAYPLKATATSASITYSLLDLATTTASCSGTVSCSSFIIIGGTPVTITGAGGSTFATTSISATYPIVWNTSTAVISTALSSSTLTASSPLTGSFAQVGTGGSLGIQQASGSQAGYLSSTDWTTFNGKLTADPFWVYANSAVSTSSPVLITASTTIGNGTQTGGLTISGGATTTGNALFQGFTSLGNATSTIFTANTLYTGPLNFGNDAGVVQGMNLPFSSAANTTPQSYDFELNGSSTISVYGQENGSGYFNSIGPWVGIATATPAVLFDIYSGAATTTLRLDNGSTKGGCIIMKDAAGGTYTEIFSQSGVLYTKAAPSSTTCN